jgi:membrane protease YdiL (CAAX protease family)
MTRGASILTLAITSEVALIVIAYLISWLCGIELSWSTSATSLTIGALCAIPLLVGNHLLWRWTHNNPSSVYARFSREIIVPLCREVTTFQAFLIGILSGVGEEVLFRGALNLIIAHWGGLFLAFLGSSVAFAWVHFIGNTKRWGGMIPLYTLVGGALWFVWFFTQSLAAAAATHALYNFLAIIWIRRLALRAEGRAA